MKNADLPVMPEPIAMTENECLSTSEYYGHNKFSGLTKREMFAMHAMQAMLSSKYVAEFNAANSDINNDLCAKAVSYADALLEELS